MSKKYRLTEAGCMLEALRKYGIGLDMETAAEIKEEFIKLMIKNGYIKKAKKKKKGKKK